MKVRALFILVFLSFTAKAQLFNIKNFSTEQGFPDSKVNAICEDRRGNLWIATDGAGLIRFDGYTFESFLQEDGLTNNFIRSVYEDHKGILWIGTEAGICTYDGLKFEKKSFLESETITAIIQDQAKNYWIGTLDNGLHWFDGRALKSLSRLPNAAQLKTINSLYFDKTSSVIWIASTKGLGKYDGADLTLATKSDGLPSENVRGIAKDKSSKIWIVTDAGASRIDSGSVANYNSRNGMRAGNPFGILADDRGNLWIGGSNGVVKFDGRTFQHHEEGSGQNSNPVTCIFKDTEGNLWFGYEKGLGKLDSERFIHFPENDQLGKRVYSIIQAINGNIICGTSLGGTTVFDGKEYTLLNKREGFTSSIVQSFYYSPDSSLWVGTADEAIYKFSKSTFHHYTPDDDFISRNVTGFAANKDKMWVATADSGVAVVQSIHDTLRVERALNVQSGLSSNKITSISSDKLSMWIGTEDQGVDRIVLSNDTTRADSVVHLNSRNGLTSNTIHTIISDSIGNVLIGTSRGLNIYHNNKLIAVTKSHGLISNNIYSLTIDRNRNVWAGTERGVDMITFSPDFKSYTIRHFETDEGFKGLEVYRNSSCLDKEGNVWFGTVNGLVKYNPTEDVEANVPPKVHITGMKLFFDKIEDTKYGDSLSAWYQVPKQLILPYNQNNLSFSFVGIYHTNPRAVRYKWMLENFDHEWSPPMTAREVTYSNIPPGNYTFKVMACNEFNVWSEVPASFSFSVKPPFWEQWWARTVGVVLIVSIVALIFQIRVRRIREKNRIEHERLEMEKNILELEQEAARLQMNPHFIFNSLNSIQGFIATNDPFQAKKYLAKFAKLMRLILENAREEFIPLANEINILENYLELEKLSANNKFEFSITTDDNIDPENIQIPPMMIQPFVENAIVHGVRKKEGRGLITLHFSRNDQLVICTLQDDGIGRKKSSVINGQSRPNHKSTGISVTQKRLDQYGAHLQVEAGVKIIDLEEDGIATGTRVIISTPHESY